MTRGGEYFVNGDLSFPGADKNHGTQMDGTYRTKFGPCVDHDGVIYCNCDNCMRLALRRLTCLRFPEDHPPLLSRDMLYPVNQADFITAHAGDLEELARTYEPIFEECLDAYTEAREHYMDPHIKRRLRELAWAEAHLTGQALERLWLRSVWYKMKKNEIAKVGKYPRGIGDMGVAASLQGFRITEYLKRAQANRSFFYKGGYIQTVKSADPFILESVFNQIDHPSGEAYFCGFSDDGGYAIVTEVGVKRFCVDISSCDASHAPMLFELYVAMFPERLRDDARKLVEQCSLPIRIKSVLDKNKKVYLKPTSPKLYSGSTITTSLNNLASILIGMALMEDKPTTVAGVQAAAARVGYAVSVDECVTLQDFQFLKHSPMYDTSGVLRPVLNVGVLLRLSGTCDGDLPGRGDMQYRANEFQQALLKGAYPRASFLLLDRMRRSHVGGLDVGDYVRYRVVDNEEYPSFRIPESEFLLRYHISDAEWSTMVQGFGDCGYGVHYADSATDAILRTDYGLCK